MPLFSIIIPTYNRADMIAETIESVINQTYPNWELIIVDDGSKDNTKEVLSNFIKKDSRINYVYQENAERSAARNNGIRHAKGEWICFLDSDDLFSPNHLANAIDLKYFAQFGKVENENLRNFNNKENYQLYEKEYLVNQDITIDINRFEANIELMIINT